MPPLVSPLPRVGDRAPSSAQLAFPSAKPVVLVFLRQCGDAFTEKTFNLLTSLSTTHPTIQCIAVSHSSRAATERWVIRVGGAWEVEVVVDEARALYAQWGLGEETASAWHYHAVSPWALYAAYRLGRDEGIWGTGVEEGDESGSQYQVGGAFAVDANGIVRWVKVASSADDIPDFQEAVKALVSDKTGLA